MVVSMEGLVKRGEVFIYRREVPKRLRAIIGKREIKLSLNTSDLGVAERRWSSVKAKVDQMLAEAEKGLHSPSVAAYKVLQGWRETSGDIDPASKREIGLDFHLTSLLDPEWQNQPIPPDQRAAVEALLKRHENGSEDNPPLTLLFDRYYAERELPGKTKLEWQGVLNRFLAVLGGDRAVRAVMPADVRGFKASLLATAGRNGKTLSAGTVKKNLGALSSVLSWAKREGYTPTNPAEGITAIAKSDGTEGRLPYSAEDLKLVFSARREGDANHWLPWLGLYTGARLEELGQLRTADVRQEDGVHYLAIEPGDGKRVKTKSSRRRVPVHPQLVKLGFLAFVAKQREAGHARLFPELKATRFALTSAWSKWWGKHARKIGVTDGRKVFHSFRHGWKDAARAVMPEEHHDAITGHSSGSVGRSYGTGVPLRVLAKSMARVRFDGVVAANRQSGE
jgi:integrase